MSATLADRGKLSSSLIAFATFHAHGILDSSLLSLSSKNLAGAVSENPGGFNGSLQHFLKSFLLESTRLILLAGANPFNSEALFRF
jgi:hypothetical protein